MNKVKPFNINKRDIWNAWLQVRSNGGSHGVNFVTIEMYEVKERITCINYGTG